jgi:replicative DNA helicase
MAVVDYAQRIKGTSSESREIEQTECSNALQTLAGDLGITIIIPSQLNEDGETKHGKVWQEDGDAVLQIVQDRNKESETYKQHRHVVIAKDRHYGTGGTRIPMVLDREYIRFKYGMDETKAAGTKPKFQR